jgi:hypothetical protein
MNTLENNMTYRYCTWKCRHREKEKLNIKFAEILLDAWERGLPWELRLASEVRTMLARLSLNSSTE